MVSQVTSTAICCPRSRRSSDNSSRALLCVCSALRTGVCVPVFRLFSDLFSVQRSIPTLVCVRMVFAGLDITIPRLCCALMKPSDLLMSLTLTSMNHGFINEAERALRPRTSVIYMRRCMSAVLQFALKNAFCTSDSLVESTHEPKAAQSCSERAQTATDSIRS